MKNTKKPVSPRDSAKPKSKTIKQLPKKPDPTRFGDWEKNGRCIDF